MIFNIKALENATDFSRSINPKYNSEMGLTAYSPISEVLETCRIRDYPKGQIILYLDDHPSDMIALIGGEVKLYNIDEQGNEKILHILKPPAIFPLAYNVYHREGVICYYGALTEVRAYLLPYDLLENEMSKNTDVANYIFGLVANEVRELLVRIDSMGKTTAQDKLIAALKFLAAGHAHIRRMPWRRVRFPVSHQLLADMTGVTRESITASVQQLLQDKVIRYPKLTVLEINYEKLRDLN